MILKFEVVEILKSESNIKIKLYMRNYVEEENDIEAVCICFHMMELIYHTINFVLLYNLETYLCIHPHKKKRVINAVRYF